MGTLNAVYVRAKGAAIESAVGDLFPGARTETGPEFTGWTLSNDVLEAPRDGLGQLSKKFATDVIWLCFQSTVDAFLFYHWQNGLLLRSLVYGCYGEEERTWNEVDGQPEPWERAAFFDPERLAFDLEYAQSADETAQLERIWREAELVPGRQTPCIDAREAARKAAQFYHFPGWG